MDTPIPCPQLFSSLYSQVFTFPEVQEPTGPYICTSPSKLPDTQVLRSPTLCFKTSILPPDARSLDAVTRYFWSLHL